MKNSINLDEEVELFEPTHDQPTADDDDDIMEIGKFCPPTYGVSHRPSESKTISDKSGEDVEKI